MIKKVLLLYKGYPRISHSYQIDEATELSKKYEILIISFEWGLFTISKNHQPYIQKNPLSCIDEIKKFKPDIIHSHYLDTIEICFKLSQILKIPFSIKTHSFDILQSENEVKKRLKYMNSDWCKTIIIFPEFYNIMVKNGVIDDKIICLFPSSYIHRFSLNIENGNNIMSGGAMLPKKNIEGFIKLAVKIKKLFPEKEINYYSVVENQEYYKKIIDLNNANGKPVNFKSCQPTEMPLEYKKHQWLIYTACPILKTVGNPMMISEAQASGVGVIIYNLRPELIDYVTENGYLYKNDDEILDIISSPFSEDKRKKAIEIIDRYDIVNNIKIIENKWNN